MSTFNEEERAALKRRLDEAAAERRRAQADPKRRKPIVDPGKWAGPLGFDSQGHPLPAPPTWVLDAHRRKRPKGH